MKLKPEGLWECSLICALLLIAIPATTPPLHASRSIRLLPEEARLVERGEVVLRELATREGESGATTVEAVARISAPRRIVVQVLTEYEQYPEFLPNVSRVEVLEQAGNRTVLNYTLSLPLGTIKKYRLRIDLRRAGKDLTRLGWEMVDWPGLPAEQTIEDTSGYWKIEQDRPEGCLVLYHVSTDPGPVPFGLGWVVDMLRKNNVPEVVRATRERAETRHEAEG